MLKWYRKSKKKGNFIETLQYRPYNDNSELKGDKPSEPVDNETTATPRRLKIPFGKIMAIEVSHATPLNPTASDGDGTSFTGMKIDDANTGD